MIRLPNTLAVRLTLWYASAFVFFLLVAFVIMYFFMNTVLNSRIDEDLEEDVEEFQLTFETNGLEGTNQEIDREVMAGDNVDKFLRLLDPTGKEIYSSSKTHWENLYTDIDVLSELNEPVLVDFKLESQEHTTRAIYGNIGPGVILHLGESLEEKEEIMEILLTVFAVMSLFVIPLAYGVGRFVAKRAVRGIEAVSQAAIDIEHGRFDHRVSVQGSGDEIETLANTFNTMAERIRSLIAEMREMIDNIAHDLRSPLGRIRAISESALSGTQNDRSDAKEFKKAASDTLEECDRLIQLINTTLDVAEAEAGVANNVTEDVNISELTEEACELFEPLAEEKEITVSPRLTPGCWLRGNKQNLQRMLVNLLDNAMKYTPTKGQVNIKLDRNDDEIQIEIADTGMGVPLPDQHRVFQRFFRCDQSRSQEGCGLGLSFARAVARTHGGDIDLASTPSEGSTFTIILPA